MTPAPFKPANVAPGDDVYAATDGDCVVLTVEIGTRTRQTIYLAPKTWAALAAFVARVEEEAKCR